MSISPSRVRSTGHPGFACYMAGVFSSATRLCAHEAGLVAGRLRVLASLHVADASEVAEARRLARQALSLERAAALQYAGARSAYKRAVAYRIIARRTSAIAQLRAKASQIEVRSKELEKAVGERHPAATIGLATQRQSGIEVWHLPSLARARLITWVASATDPALMNEVVAWAQSVKPRDQLLLRIVGPDQLVFQIARPTYAHDTWPWTVRVRAGLSTSSASGELPSRLTKSLAAQRFVDHGARDGLWCHMAPGSPRELGAWLVLVLGEALPHQ